MARGSTARTFTLAVSADRLMLLSSHVEMWHSALPAARLCVPYAFALSSCPSRGQSHNNRLLVVLTLLASRLPPGFRPPQSHLWPTMFARPTLDCAASGSPHETASTPERPIIQSDAKRNTFSYPFVASREFQIKIHSAHVCF